MIKKPGEKMPPIKAVRKSNLHQLSFSGEKTPLPTFINLEPPLVPTIKPPLPRPLIQTTLTPLKAPSLPIPVPPPTLLVPTKAPSIFVPRIRKKTLQVVQPFFSMCEKYAPVQSNQLLGNGDNYTKLTRWIQKRKEADPKVMRAAFVSGGIGTGKSVGVRLVLKQQGYNIHEINTTSMSPEKTLCEIVRGVVTRQPLHGPTAVIIEEIDAMFIIAKHCRKAVKDKEERKKEQDISLEAKSSKIGNLAKLLQTFGHKCPPIIITCSSRDEKEVRELEKVCYNIKWESPQEKDLVLLGKRICQLEKHALSEEVIREVAKESGNDIRRFLNSLEMVTKKPLQTDQLLLQHQTRLDSAKQGLFTKKQMLESTSILQNSGSYATELLEEEIRMLGQSIQKNSASGGKESQKDFVRKNGTDLFMNPFKMATCLVYTPPTLQVSQACAIYEQDPHLMKEFIMENFGSVFGGISFKHKEAVVQDLEHMAQMLEDTSAVDAYSRWNTLNPALDAVQAYTLHVHRNKSITERVTGVDPIRFPSFLMTQKQKNKAKKDRQSLHKKISFMAPIDSFDYYLDNLRNQLEKYPTLPEHSKDPFVETKDKILHFLIDHQITQLELSTILERKNYSFRVNSSKSLVIKVGLGPNSLTFRFHEALSPTVYDSKKAKKTIKRKASVGGVNIVQKKQKT